MAKGVDAYYLVQEALFGLGDLDDSKEVEVPRSKEEGSENLLEGVISENFSSNIQNSEGIIDVIARDIEIEPLKPKLLSLWCCKQFSKES